MKILKIGDRVIARNMDVFVLANNEIGTIVKVEEGYNFWVNFDKNVRGLECIELGIKDGHGLYLNSKRLELVERREEKIEQPKIRGFEVVSDIHRKHEDVEIQLPTRGSKVAAGYDFYSPIKVEIQPHSKVCIWSDVKAYMQEGEVLMLFVRSSIGIKKGLRLSNSTGVVDMDYYSNESNDGNIGIALHNYTDEVVVIEEGERVCQGVFMPFLVADSGNTDKERLGGIGSTGN